MCGIFGHWQFNEKSQSKRSFTPESVAAVLSHRGPDGTNVWKSSRHPITLVHHRLSVIDLSLTGNQPMAGPSGEQIVFNGEIYNFRDLKKLWSSKYSFHTQSDTETILAAYQQFGAEGLAHLRGMFAFALWDENKQQFFCARDRFGIKPFYYIFNDEHFIFASEMKALLPFLDEIKTNHDALSEYLSFQYTLGGHTLFDGIHELPPGHFLIVQKGKIQLQKYWDVKYEIDFSHPAEYFEERLRELLTESVKYHLVSDVPVGGYLSGGLDSTLINSLAADQSKDLLGFFHGKFTDYPGYDESAYAQLAASHMGKPLMQISVTANDFITEIQKIIYHLDVPIAGPGALPQFMVSRLAAENVKVVLAGQGGDEIFGGYARYLIAYFEQAIKAAIEGTHKNGNFVVTPESIIPNLVLLKNYKPLIKEFWREGTFGPLDERYFRLIDRSSDMQDEIDWNLFDKKSLLQKFKMIFNNEECLRKEAYFDKMTRFDFKNLLPALLHVEDRMSMAHGLESRVPFLDHPLVEFVATIPANFKFSGGNLKNLLKTTFDAKLPREISSRQDKMGFPVPLTEWGMGPLKDFFGDIFSSQAAKTRGFYHADSVVKSLGSASQFSRKIWGLLSLELWHRTFHDRAADIKKGIVNL